MRRWWIRFAVIAGIILAGAVLRRTVLAPKPLEVKVAAVSRGRVESTITNSRAGTVKARRRAQISPEVGGRAVAIPHREGEMVKAGEVLLRLNDSVLQGQLEVSHRGLQTAEAQRQQTCTGAERSRRELARQRKLVVQNGKLVERKLEIGLKNWDWTEVRSGLAPGAAVVTSLDSPDVKPGAAVRVAPDGKSP